MSLFFTVSVLFLFTLFVPAFASAGHTDDPDAMQRRVNRLRDTVAALQAEQQALQSGNAPLRERQAISAEILATTNQLNVAIQEQIMRNNEGTAAARAAAAQIRELNKAYKKATEGAKASQAAARSLANELGQVMGISSSLGNNIVGQFIKARQEGASFGEMARDVTAAMRDKFSVGNILFSVMGKLAEATLAAAVSQDRAISAFIRATGAGTRYNEVMENVFLNTRNAGVGFGEAGAALGSLFTNMASFSTLNSTVAGDLARQTALMSELGISADSTARAFNTLVQSMGQTPAEAARISREMVTMAESLGIPPARMIQEFAQAAPQLAQHGAEMTRVFYQLEAASKATGVALGNLLGLASQYDTFQGAAEAAGRLNAVLGGPYLNAIQLLNANESERIRLLIQGVEASGRSFESMGRFERRAVAAAAGISDMNQAASIFNQTTAQFDASQRRIAAAAMSEAELAQRAREAQDVFEILKNTFITFAITMRPVVEGFRDVVEIVGRFGNAISQSEAAGKIVRMVAIVGTLTAALSVAGAALASLTSGVGLAVSVIGGLAAIFTVGHSPTFPEYIGIAAINMGNLARSAREALPSVAALNREMSMTAAAMASTATAATNANLRATAGGLSVVRVEESAELKNIFYKLLQSNEHYANRLEAAATSETVLHMNGREFGRAAKAVVNREMRMQGKAF